MFKYILIGLCVFTCSKVHCLICDDIDTQACQLIAARRPDMCNDTSISTGTCPRFCKKCALECYHCNEALTDFNNCNVTQSCNPGEVCMLRELRSSADGHQEYVMTCEPKQECDGSGLTFPFGRRDIQSRDITVKCCETDLCNYPSSTQPTMTTTTMPTVTSSPSGCLKDIIFVVDESRSMSHDRHDILDFLASLVGDLNVSKQGTRVSMGTFSSTAHNQFDFDRYTTTQDLQAAIKAVHFRGGTGDAAAGLGYILQHASMTQYANRPGVPDAVLFITDDKISSILENALHAKISDVIAVGVGHHINSIDLQAIATDAAYIIQESDADDLINHKSQIVQLLCS